ncbi:MAG: DUF3318 domain-containing protein [Cyanobacteria bacterium SID2]|nr:DUF3318 domain-containing protein [Cyanobacteria bacterium SID2]MBP0006358.1 DUF3318 domain-containing protein [Cyanobacteria bacterium SBC]
MNPAPEIRRLLDLMPASGRMMTKIVSQPTLPQVIDTPFPLPWKRERPIFINFEYWKDLSQAQRDLLLLRTVCWQLEIRWFKLDLYRGFALAGIFATSIEVFQGDPVGIVAAGGLTAIALNQVWRKTKSEESELAADEAAIAVAQRRGYEEVEAAKHLLSAIKAVADLEGRPGLSFTELIRGQNLRSIAGVSPVGVPETIRQKR